MLEKAMLLGLAGYAFSFALQTFPLLEWIRKLLEKISHKLSVCVFCQTFWFSMSLMLVVGFFSSNTYSSFENIFYYLLISFIVSLAAASVAKLLSYVEYVLDGIGNMLHDRKE
jgi:hypothetical protein